MATLRGRVQKAIRGALRAGERRAARRTTEAQIAQATGAATALAYARHLDAELTLAAPIMRQAYLDEWWARATPEEIGAVWEATTSWAAVGEGFAQATMAHLREQISQRYGIDVRDVRLQGREVVALLARARGVAPAPEPDARTASFVIRDTATGTVAAQQIQVAPPPGMSHGEFAARWLIEYADRLGQQAGAPADGLTDRFVVETYAGGDVTVEPTTTISGEHASEAAQAVGDFRQQILNGSTPAPAEELLDALLVEEHRLAQELSDHITALDFATAEGIVMHANRAAVIRERLDYTRLRIQAAQADVRGEDGIHVFQQASLRARYDDAWWADATATEAATLWRYVAGWSEGSAKLWTVTHLQEQIQARFGVSVATDADARQVAETLRSAQPRQDLTSTSTAPRPDTAGQDRSVPSAPAPPAEAVADPVAQPAEAARPSEQAEPSDRTAAPTDVADPASDASSPVAPPPEPPSARAGDEAAIPPATTAPETAARAADTPASLPPEPEPQLGTDPTDRPARDEAADQPEATTQAAPAKAPEAAARDTPPSSPQPDTEAAERTTEAPDGTAEDAPAPATTAQPPALSPSASALPTPAPEPAPIREPGAADLDPQASEFDQAELPPLAADSLTLERLTEALHGLGADDVADTLPAVFAILDNPPREDRWFADVDQGVEAFARMHQAVRDALPRLPDMQGERWWLLQLADELEYQARRAGYPSMDRDDVAERTRYAAMSDAELRAELDHTDPEHDTFDTLVEMLERRGFDEFGTPARGTPHGLESAIPFDPAMEGALVRVNRGAGTIVVGTVQHHPNSGWWVDGVAEHDGDGTDRQPRPEQVWLQERQYGAPHVQVLQTAAERQQTAPEPEAAPEPERAADPAPEPERVAEPERAADAAPEPAPAPEPEPERAADPAPEAAPEHSLPDREPSAAPSATDQGSGDPENADLARLAAEPLLLNLILTAAEGNERAMARLAGNLDTIDDNDVRWIDVTAADDLRVPFTGAVTDRRSRLAAVANDEESFGIVFDDVFADYLIGQIDTVGDRIDDISSLAQRYFSRGSEYRDLLNQSARRAAWNLIRAHQELTEGTRPERTRPGPQASQADQEESAERNVADSQEPSPPVDPQPPTPGEDPGPEALFEADAPASESSAEAVPVRMFPGGITGLDGYEPITGLDLRFRSYDPPPPGGPTHAVHLLRPIRPGEGVLEDLRQGSLPQLIAQMLDEGFMRPVPGSPGEQHQLAVDPQASEPTPALFTADPESAPAGRSLDEQLDDITSAADQMTVDGVGWGRSSLYTRAEQAERGHDLVARLALLMQEAVQVHGGHLAAAEADVLAGSLARLQQPATGDWERDAAALHAPLEAVLDLAHGDAHRGTPLARYARELAISLRAHESSLSGRPSAEVSDIVSSAASYSSAQEVWAAQGAVRAAHEQIGALEPGLSDREGLARLAAAVDLATTDTSGGPAGHVHRYRRLADQAQAIADANRGPVAVAANGLWAHAVQHQARLVAGMRHEEGVQLRTLLAEVAATTAPDEPAAETAEVPEQRAPEPIWIEHNNKQTIVHGRVTKGGEVHALLKAGGFLWAPSLGCWKTNSRWRFETRDARVRALARGLALAGRPFRLEQYPPGQEPTAQSDAQPAPQAEASADRELQLPSGEPYNTWPEAQNELRPVAEAFSRLHRSTAWRHMISDAEDSRSDAKALAALVIPGKVLGADGTEVLSRFTALAQRTHVLLENLQAEGYTHAPLLLPQLRELRRHGVHFAARLQATAEAADRWPMVFKAPGPVLTASADAPEPVAVPERHRGADSRDSSRSRGDDSAAALQGSLFDFGEDPASPDAPADAAPEAIPDAVDVPGEHSADDALQRPAARVRQDGDQARDQQERTGEQVRDQGAKALAGMAAGPIPAAERSGGVLPAPGGDRSRGSRQPGGLTGGGGPGGGDVSGEAGAPGDGAATGREPDRAGPAAGGSGGRGEDRSADELSTGHSEKEQPGPDTDTAPGEVDEHAGDGAEPAPEQDGHGSEPGTGQGGEASPPEAADGAEPAPSRFVPSGQDDLAPSGPVARIRANLEAVKLVRELQTQQRPATAEEQQILARWSGWGAVPAVFDTRETVDGKPGPGVKYAWAREQLQDLLTEDEYAAARRNTINAHFTDAGMVQAIWSSLEQMGFSGGLVLEPGCGSGNFIGLAPADATMVGVEWDPTTAAIAAALYPDATVRSESFATTRLPEASFNAVVGNVPFGKLRLRDARYNPGRQYSIHNHFIAKSLRLVAPGGMVALITSRYTLDGTDERALEARRKMGELADLVGAVRLPSGAHQRAAGTDVVTDLVILRRREPGRTPSQVAWMQAPTQQIEGDNVAINEYFATHPDMVLGEFGVSGRREAELMVRSDRDPAPALAQALQQITEHAREHELLSAPVPSVGPDQVLMGNPISLEELEGPNGRLAWTEGFISPRDDGTFTQIVDGAVEPYEPRMSAAEADELRALCGLRDATLELLAAEERADQPEMDRLRARLNERYDAYATRYGPINRVNLIPSIKKTPEGEALRARLLAEGNARIAGGTFVLVGDEEQTRELQGRLLADGLATVGEDGRLRMRQSNAARAERDRLVATGLARVEGGRLELIGEGRAIAIDAAPEAIRLIRRRPSQGGFRTDPFAVRVQALERYSPKTGQAAKTDIFREPVMPARAPIEIADSPADALAICMDQHAQVRLDVIADLLGLDDESQARAELGDLVFHDPAQDRLVPAAEYLSGDVRLKLKQATTAATDDPALRVNVEALTGVIPEDLGPAEIEVRLGSVIVDPEHVQQFLRETLDAPKIKVSLSSAGEWKVTGAAKGVLSTSIWGTEDANATYLAGRLLNQKAIKITKKIDEETTVVDAEATEAAQEKAQELNERFGEWIWEDLDRGALIVRRYNDRFNSLVLRSYDDVQLSLPGLNRNISLRWWQKAAVARMIHEPATGLFHDMGAGKTLEQIIGMMELRRLGLINKPVMCVKNHMLDQVRDEFLWAYPSARVLCADSSELTGEGKRRFIARCMQENPDAVILTRGAFESINLTPEGVRDYLDFAEDFFRAHQDEEDSVKDEETILINFKEKIEAFIEGDEEEDDEEEEGEGRQKKKRKGIDKDPALTWEHAGFDYIVIDESQDYNNLWTPSNVEGMEIDFVRRCVDLEMKLHSTRKRFGERVATFATGTPITNRIVQYHVLQRYLRPDRLKEAGFYSADSWLATYATQKTRLELKGDNTWGPVSRTSELVNVPEMLLEIHHFSDFKTADDINLPRPAIDGGKPEVRVVPATLELTDYQGALANRYAAARKNRGRKGEDTCVAVIGDGFRAGQDLRLVDPNHGPIPDIPDDPQKVEAVAEDILKEWKAHRDDVYLDANGDPDPVRGSLLAVFCNEGVPSDSWNIYDHLRQLLVDGGMSRDRIRFIHETGSDSRKKRDLTADCNDGHVDVLIGSTEKMGVGTNFQRRLVGIYQMHPHWRPDYDDQEIARGRRPGNENSVIFVRKFITEGSYDIIRAQRCEMKAAFLAHLKRRDPTVRTIEVPDEDTVGYAEIAALAAGDMRLVEKNKLEQELKSLVRGQRAHARKQNGLKMSIRQAEHGIGHSQKAIVDIDRAIAQRQPTAGDAFTMTLAGVRHTKRTDAGAHLRTVLSKAMDATPRGRQSRVEIGTLGGFPIEANLDRDRRPTTILLTLKGVHGGEIGLNHKTVPGGTGLIRQLENRLSNLETERQWHERNIPACRLEIERAQPLLGESFPHQDRLNEVRTRLSDLQRQLTTPDPDPAGNHAADPQAPAAPAPTAEGPGDGTPALAQPAAAEHGDPQSAEAPAVEAPAVESPAFAAAKVASAGQPRSITAQLRTAAKNSRNGGGDKPSTAPDRQAPAIPASENQR
ncbi:hypothetical protein [Actinomadura napierensis]|uniref:Uncharacterized protein n=1 Tax=Actinomadura napierensis TaxID=267854 RepID=A0ABP5LLI9_9ACTN